MPNYNFLEEATRARSAELPGQGYNIQREGYDANPEAKLSFVEKAYTSSGNKQEKAHLFREAFRTARSAGLKEFTLGGKRYNTKLKEEVDKEQAEAVATKAVEHIVKNEGVVHDKTKGQFDMEQVGINPVHFGEAVSDDTSVFKMLRSQQQMQVPQLQMLDALSAIRANPFGNTMFANKSV